MNTTFLKNQWVFFIQLTIVTLAMLVIHAYLNYYFLADNVLFFLLWQIYLFQFVVTSILYTIINYKHSNGNKLFFNVFMSGTLIKMLLSIVFLLPLLAAKTEKKEPDIINFFIPYFLFLIFEVYSLTKLVNKK